MLLLHDMQHDDEIRIYNLRKLLFPPKDYCYKDLAKRDIEQMLYFYDKIKDLKPEETPMESSNRRYSQGIDQLLLFSYDIVNEKYDYASEVLQLLTGRCYFMNARILNPLKEILKILDERERKNEESL